MVSVYLPIHYTILNFMQCFLPPWQRAMMFPPSLYFVELSKPHARCCIVQARLPKHPHNVMCHLKVSCGLNFFHQQSLKNV